MVAALAKVPEPRARRGVRHQISAILALAACAALAGCRSFTAIGEWVAHSFDQVLVALEVDGRPRLFAASSGLLSVRSCRRVWGW